MSYYALGIFRLSVYPKIPKHVPTYVLHVIAIFCCTVPIQNAVINTKRHDLVLA